MSRFSNFLTILQKSNSDITIKTKEESTLMKLIGKILFFNKDFMTRFVTTIGSTIYVPKALLEPENEEAAIGVLAHEYMHVVDYKKNPIWFTLIYLFPALLSPFMMFFGFLDWQLAGVLAAVLLLPLPAPGRKSIEFRGYTMTLFAANHLMKEKGWTDQERKDKLFCMMQKIDNEFTSFNYYVMWMFGVMSKLETQRERILSGEIKKDDDIYGIVEEALVSSKTI